MSRGAVAAAKCVDPDICVWFSCFLWDPGQSGCVTPIFKMCKSYIGEGGWGKRKLGKYLTQLMIHELHVINTLTVLGSKSHAFVPALSRCPHMGRCGMFLTSV